MKRATAAAEQDEKPAKRLKVHPSGYTFEFVNEVQIKDGEIFMPIPEWYIKDNKTYVSNQGRVKNYVGVITKPNPKKDGYSYVKIKGKNLPLTNNKVSNLRWVTRSENIQASFAKNKDRKSNAPQQSKKVRATKNGDVQIFASTQEAGRQLGIHRGLISIFCIENVKIAASEENDARKP